MRKTSRKENTKGKEKMNKMRCRCGEETQNYNKDLYYCSDCNLIYRAIPYGIYINIVEILDKAIGKKGKTRGKRI